MGNKIRAKHYSIIILAAIVVLETSAIAIDRFLAKQDNTAFEIVGQFKNNSFIERFAVAEAKSPPIPTRLVHISPSPKVISSPVSVIKPSLKIPLEEEKRETPLISKAKSQPAQKEKFPPIPKLDLEKWTSYQVNRGDSLNAIAETFGVSSKSLKSMNQISENHTLKAGRKIKVPMNSERIFYSVKAGDSLSRIGGKFGIPIQDLIKENNLRTHNLIVGQKLEIPLKLHNKTLEIVKTDEQTETVEKKLVMAVKSGIGNLTLIKPNEMKKIPDPISKPKIIVAQALATKTEKEEIVKKEEKSKNNYSITKVVKTEEKKENEASESREEKETKVVCHIVKSGESLSSIARKYKSSISEIIAKNPNSKSSLKIGQQVSVPVNKRFYRVLQVTSRRADVSTKLGMPIRGKMSDPYGWRVHPVYHRRLFHAGVDWAAPRGTHITAAMGGQVIYAGWLSGYGKLVVIRHSNGLSTRYGHCSSLRVKKGQTVRKGQIIAGVGSTGTATGNHLHFEVRRNGKAINPLVALSTR